MPFWFLSAEGWSEAQGQAAKQVPQMLQNKSPLWKEGICVSGECFGGACEEVKSPGQSGLGQHCDLGLVTCLLGVSYFTLL